jgi:hypothetical protein
MLRSDHVPEVKRRAPLRFVLKHVTQAPRSCFGYSSKRDASSGF